MCGKVLYPSNKSGICRDCKFPKKYCSVCGKRLRGDNTTGLCKKCMTPEPSYCVVCGAEVTKGSTYCQHCYSGDNHHYWKGADVQSPDYMLARNHPAYYRWRRQILRDAGHQCEECGEIEHLHVHHDTIPFVDIIVAMRNKYPTADPQTIAQLTAEYHISHQVTGIVLCEPCHHKAHQQQTTLS